MQPKKLPPKKGPEAILQEDWTTFLEARGWVVKSTHGGMFQAGFPDLWITHKDHGGKWAEVKLPDMKGSRWTDAQKYWFPILTNHGTPIWIITTPCEQEYRKLFEYKDGNYMEYLLIHHW